MFMIHEPAPKQRAELVQLGGGFNFSNFQPYWYLGKWYEMVLFD